MGALNKLLVKTITKMVKNSTKLDLAIEDLMGKIKGVCPPKDELLLIIERKNQLKLALNNIIEVLPKINKTANIASGVVTAAEFAIIPLQVTPTPPFAPTGLIASNIDKISKTLEDTNDVLSAVRTITPPILNILQLIVSKLDIVDGLVDKCIEDLTDSEKEELLGDIVEIKSFGDSENNNKIEDRLNAKSTNPYLYKKTSFTTQDWRFTLESNADNKFSFPQRRIVATNINNNEDNIYKGVVVYNTSDGKYSYSNSIEVLIEEAKFSVEQLNDKLYQVQ